MSLKNWMHKQKSRYLNLEKKEDREELRRRHKLWHWGKTTHFKKNGKRECARRRRQMANGTHGL